MNPPLTIALASDENYLDGLVGTLAGAARSAPGTKIEAVVLDCGIRDASWALMERAFSGRLPLITLRRLKITADQLRVFNPSNAACRLNNSSYARLLLPELLSDKDRVLYLDCDLVVDAPLGPLFATSFDGAFLAAVPDSHTPTLGQTVPAEFLADGEAAHSAFNAGVLLMNLAAMRAERLTDRIVALPPSFRPKLQDQACLNYVVRGAWKPLSPRWNRQRFVTENFSLYRDSADSVWHFIGQTKPWHFDPSFARGLVADFHRNIVSTGWIPRVRGDRRPLSPGWRDGAKATRAFALRAGFIPRPRASR